MSAVTFSIRWFYISFSFSLSHHCLSNENCLFVCLHVHFVLSVHFTARTHIHTTQQANKQIQQMKTFSNYLVLSHSLIFKIALHIAAPDVSFVSLNHLSVFNLKSSIFWAKLIMPGERMKPRERESARAKPFSTIFKLNIFCTSLLHADERVY